MFFAEAQIRVHLYGQPTDMRKSYDGTLVHADVEGLPPRSYALLRNYKSTAHYGVPS